MSVIDHNLKSLVEVSKEMIPGGDKVQHPGVSIGSSPINTSLHNTQKTEVYVQTLRGIIIPNTSKRLRRTEKVTDKPSDDKHSRISRNGARRTLADTQKPCSSTTRKVKKLRRAVSLTKFKGKTMGRIPSFYNKRRIRPWKSVRLIPRHMLRCRVRYFLQCISLRTGCIVISIIGFCYGLLCTILLLLISIGFENWKSVYKKKLDELYYLIFIFANSVVVFVCSIILMIGISTSVCTWLCIYVIAMICHVILNIISIFGMFGYCLEYTNCFEGTGVGQAVASLVAATFYSIFWIYAIVTVKSYRDKIYYDIPSGSSSSSSYY